MNKLFLTLLILTIHVNSFTGCNKHHQDKMAVEKELAIASRRVEHFTGALFVIRSKETVNNTIEQETQQKLVAAQKAKELAQKKLTELFKDAAKL